MKLSEICNLKGGFQGKITEGGNVFKLIKLKDVNSDGVINYDELDYFTPEKEMNDKYVLKKGDVILKAKSGDNIAAIIDGNEDNIVATSHYIILTVKDVSVLNPEYLEVYLNSEYAKEYYIRNSEGTSLSIIKLKAIEDMEIKLVDLKKQKEISKVYNLMKEEKKIVEKIVKNRESQFKQYLRESLM